MKIDVVDWKLVGTCNMNCLHCYGPAKNVLALPLDQLLRIVDTLGKLSVEWVVLTGGEPLMVPNIETVMKRITETGAKIGLSTNTTYFRTFQRTIEQYVASLNIPLDGSTPQIHAKSRGDEESYDTFFDILKHYRANHGTKPELLRVGTVFSRANQGDFIQLARKLESFADQIDTWKIYEIIDYDIQQELRSPLIPDPGSFQPEMDRLLESTPLASKIMLSPANSRDKAYFMVDPKARLVIPENENGVTREVPFGNLLSEPLGEIIERWAGRIRAQNYTGNHAHYEKLVKIGDIAEL